MLKDRLLSYSATAIIALLGALWLHLVCGGAGVDLTRMLQMLTGSEADGFSEIQFLYSDLPRSVLALFVGAALGINGSVMQQLTQNPLASPLTLGTAAGAWLAIVIAAILSPQLLAEYQIGFSLAGAAVATLINVLLTGWRRLDGLALVITGVAINISLVSVATLLTLLNEGYVDNWFIWGAGDLTQVDWSTVRWFAPQSVVLVGLCFVLTPAMLLLRQGAGQAAARGLATARWLVLGAVISIGLTATSVTAVGIISFVALLAPHLARLLGARTPRAELAASALLGALSLILTDCIAMLVSQNTGNLLPSGSSATLLGAPLLIVALLKTIPQNLFEPRTMPGVVSLHSKNRMTLVLVALLTATLAAALFFSAKSTGWRWHWPNQLQWDLRLPRVFASVAAGAGMALSGLVFQRLFRNPLISPDIVGISSGATLALLCGFVFFQMSAGMSSAVLALTGSISVLFLLLIMSVKFQATGARLIIVGLALTATAEAMIQFVIAQGGESSYRLLSWLSGSTYRTDGLDAVVLSATVISITLILGAMSRWLALLELGDEAASARGLPLLRARVLLLSGATLLAAVVTALVGPIAFVGLVAPHVARLLGARSLFEQVAQTLLIGATLFVVADWLARNLFHPAQVPAGTVCAVIGAAYLAYLMRRYQHKSI
ncbi:MAG: Fe(3+)-hydroxamate ABC transporter permease FhuB [Pseudomonadota bacterium]